MLSVQGLVSGYGPLRILNEASFSVGKGEFVGILGHNGVGKTTLLRTIMGYLRATGGRVALNGRDITALPTHARARLGLSLVPQGREIFPALTVRDNLRMGMAARKVDEAHVIEAILADFPRLKRLLDRTGGALSGGEQQLLALARCLCADPQVVLLDEPTEGIQPSINEEIVDTLRRIRVARGLTMVLVEQNLDFIAALADRVLIIQKGAITRELEPGKLHDVELMGEFMGFAAAH